jgi:hypothetical protein
MRKTKKLARARQQAWDEIRKEQVVDHGALYPAASNMPVAGAHRPPLIAGSGNSLAPTLRTDATEGFTTEHFDTHVERRRSGARTMLAVFHPVAGAFALVLLLVAGSPLVAGTWSTPWIAGASIAVMTLVLLYPRASRGAGANAQVMGLGLGLVVLVAGIAGIIGQNVVEGRAQLRGSDVDRGVEEHRELVTTLAVLSENQRLLTLPPEQAIPLGSVYANARQQAITIGERWNPATKPNPPLPELAKAYELVNIAAAQQAAALDGFVANLENPEPALEAEYIERGLAVDALLRNEIPVALEAIEEAVRVAVLEGKDA